jgi:exodeoxyribonuclease VII large subunit
MIQPYFERTTGQPLRAGLKVLLKVYAQYHEAFGFSWIITDIDPTYTLGDMERKRQEIIRQLKEEGVFDLQKGLRIPTFAQRIAIISAEGAAGYGDFMRQLEDNEFGFHFDTTLFPAIMQGEQVEESVIKALNNIYGQIGNYDVVVILRGGGATADLSGFDTLTLAENVAQFPLPIITGIGHERDESILDMISNTRVKTPTAAAAFLISHLQEVLDIVETSQNLITRYAQQKLLTLNTQLATISESIPHLFSVVKTRQESKIEALYLRIPMLLERKLTGEQHRLQLLEEKLKGLDPTLLLSRGYSITLHNGKAVTDASQLQPGDEIETRVAKGTLRSTVTHSYPSPHETH